MVKVLIVDDFLADRRSIRSLLNGFTHLNIQVTGEAENGLQALEQIELDRPDIVISDIEMPVCDGFELARGIRIQYPDIKIIFCSLYDEFEYARQALYFGGYGYILKPINPFELEQCIQRVTGKIIDETAELRRREESDEIRSIITLYKPILVENLLKEILLGVSNTSLPDMQDRLASLDIDLLDCTFQVAYFEIDDFETITESDSFLQRQAFSLRISRRIQEIVALDKWTPLVRLDDAHFALIFTLQSTPPSLLSRRAYDACTRVLVDFLKSDVSITIAFSQTCDTVSSISGLYQQCLYQIKHKYLLGKGKIILPDDVPSTRISPNLDLNNILKDVRFLINSGTNSQIMAYIEGLFQTIPHAADETYLKNLCYYLVFCTQSVVYENNETFKEIFGSEMHVWEKVTGFETVEDAAKWIREIVIAIHQFLAAKASNANIQIVERVKKYIEANYVKNISLDNMAVDLFYSPNYLNRVFKQVTGETIFNFSSAYRIEKAKEMLLDPKMKLSGVSQELGYSNPAYFSYIFKKATGLTPKEYRERMAR